MNRDELSDWLDSAWETVCQSAYDEPDPEVDHSDFGRGYDCIVQEC